MNSLSKILLALLTLIPALYFFIVMTGVVEVSYDTIGKLHVSVMILSAVLAVIYVTNVVRNPVVDREKRFLWGVLVVLGGFVFQVIYFLRYIAPASASQRSNRST